MIEVQDATKVYRMGSVEVHALRGVSVTIEKGEMVAIIGASGSGKSTLMNIIGCLDRPSSGRYIFNGNDVSHLGDNQLAEMRNRRFGFVFQDFNLLPRVDALANVELPLLYSGTPHRHNLAMSALERVGLGARANHKPSEMSGGEQQRVAIARALVNKPELILADEPTGNLDSVTTNEIVALFRELNGEGITVVMVTHEMHVAEQNQRIIRLKDGLVDSDKRLTRD